jgi:YVTN family beta-propeller protein
VSPDGQYIYAYPTSPVTPWVAKVRTSDGAVFTPVYTAFVGSPFGSSIAQVVLSPDARSLAVIPLLSSAGADLVATDTMSRTQVIGLGIANGRAAYSADGVELYVSDSANDQIAVVNTSTYSVTQWSSGGDDPRGLVAAESGTVFVTNRSGDSVVSLRSSSVTGSAPVVNPQLPVLTQSQDRVLVPSGSGNALAIITVSSMSRELVAVGSSPANVATARGYAVVSNNGSNSVSIIRLADLPASGDQVPTSPLQQFGRIEAHECNVDIPDSVLFPGVGLDQRADGWSRSWAQWPNGGTGGFVCTRQPYYTNTGQWSVG